MQLRVAPFYSLLIHLLISLLQAVYLFNFLRMPLLQVFLLLCKSVEPSCLNARDIILLFAGRSVTSVFCSPRKESIFHWRQELCTQREGDKHIGGKICSVNENGEFCCRNLQASRSLLSWLKPVGLLQKFCCWVRAVRELPHAGRSAVNPSWLFGQDKNHH